MSITLYGAPLSPFVRKTRVALALKGIPFAWEKTDPFNPPEHWRELSPLGKIPALAHGDLKLADSSVICQYLERAFPETQHLYPLDAAEYAKVLWFEKFADYEVAGNCTFFVFRERCLMPLLGRSPNEEKAQHALTTLVPPLFDYLNQTLDNQEYLVGNTLSMADIALASQLVNLEHAGETLDSTRWPHLSAFAKRLHALPEFAELIAEERSFLQYILKKIAASS